MMTGKFGARRSGRWRRALAGLAATVVFACSTSSLSAQQAAAPPKAGGADCPAGMPRRAFNLQTYNANITTHPNAERVKGGDLVEFNPNSLRDPAGYLRQVSERGGLPEWYWVGVNCDKGPDCQALRSAGARLGSTGTAEWNKTESRIEDLTHPAVIARAEKEMERALRAAAAAGSDLAFRIDNMHQLDDRRFYDREHTRSDEELSVLTEAWDRVVARLSAASILPRTALIGLTAHNNFAFWERHLGRSGTRPLLLRMENPTQFPKEFATGLRVMARYSIPLIAVEFRNGHKYKPTEAQIRDVAAKVSLLVLMEDEDNYEDGTPMRGQGPRVIVGGGAVVPSTVDCVKPGK